MNIQTIDLLISHHQVFIRSIPYQEQLTQWGEGNIRQGMVLSKNIVVFDPIADGSFGANVNLYFKNEFVIDSNAQRAVVVPFIIENGADVFVGSVAEEFKVELPLPEGSYMLYYEICIKEEVYLNITFIKSLKPECKVLLNDDYGLNTTTTINEGVF
jgi:hypothetical protein